MNTVPAVNAFIGKPEAPTEKELTAELGKTAKALWDRLISEVGEQVGAHVQEWNSYSPKAGWSLRLKRAKRNILYLIPHTGGFQVAFVLGDKAMTAAREASLPGKVLKMIDSGTKYPEGTGFRIDVDGPQYLVAISKLASIKVKN